jgi:RNA polymerase sigma-70 factor (ECF subfamily)
MLLSRYRPIRTPKPMTSNLLPREEPSTRPSLLRRARDGSEQAWQNLVQIYGPIVYRWMRRCGAQSADAADVMQETLLAVSRALSRFDEHAAEATFRGWLWTIAKNKLRDRQRLAQQRRELDGSAAHRQIEATPSAEPPDSPPSSIEDDRRLGRLRALETLRPTFDARTWQMFWETAISGRAPADVAEDLQVSRWAVYKARARVLKRLREELDGLE